MLAQEPQMDANKTKEWLESLVEKAYAEAHQKDTTLLNQLGNNPAIAHYINNVHLRKAMSWESWLSDYNPMARAANNLREAYEADAAKDARLITLESKFDKLTEMVTKLVESIEQEAPAAPPEPPAQKPTPKQKPAPAAQPDQDDEETTPEA